MIREIDLVSSGSSKGVAIEKLFVAICYQIGIILDKSKPNRFFFLKLRTSIQVVACPMLPDIPSAVVALGQWPQNIERLQILIIYFQCFRRP
jgi:hypothetical protein